ncbi:MAG TPA: hypothetical protein PK880_07690 [Candidatus Competibacter sp.]|nr:hypothetical protein [Candidatus Competibacter sp.]
MLTCKACGSTHYTKNGRVRGVQRYRCKGCGLNYVRGDRRVAPKRTAQRALAVILYALGKASFGFLGKLFGVSRTTAYHWIRAEAERLGEAKVPGGLLEMEFDELWHFTGSKKQTMDHQGAGSWHTAKCRLGGGRS